MKWIILLLTVFSFTTIANKINFVPKASWGDASYHNIELVDNIAFIGTDGVLVLDLSDSTSPKKVTKIQIPIDENVIKIEKANNLLFVLTASEFFTIDVESLTNPQVISRINYNLNGKFVDFALADDKLFILQEESPHLLYYDLSDVANPQFSRSKSVQDATRPVNLRALEIVGNNLFVSSLYDTQLLSLQSSDFLTQIYYYETGLNSYSTGKSLAKSIGSKIIYLNSDTSKVELFDFTDTNQVKRELVYDGSSNSPRDFKITDDRLHVVTAAGVLQFSLKSENYLQKLSEISYPYEDSYSGIGIGGDYIVLVSSSHIEVRAYGTTLSRYSMSGNNFISLVNNKLVTGGKSARIFDLSNGSFALKNTIDWSSLHYDLTEIHVKENYFFNGNGDIYQISDDFQADNVSSFIKVNNIWSFRLNENRMIRAANGQLDVFDVSQPLASKLILSMTTSELPVHISDYTIKGNNIYGATNDGLYQIRINDSGQIIKQGYIRSDGYSHARLIHKDNLYEIVENQAIGYDLIIWDISMEVMLSKLRGSMGLPMILLGRCLFTRITSFKLDEPLQIYWT